MGVFPTLLLVFSTTQIETSEPLVFAEHAPVVLRSTIEIPAGWQAQHDWIVSGAGAGRVVDESSAVCIWSPPGTSEVKHLVFLVNFDLEQTDIKAEYFLVKVQPRAPPAPPGPDPAPDPDPIPPSPDESLTRTVARLAAALTPQQRQQGRDQYKSVSEQLADGRLPTIAAALQQLVTLPLYAQVREFYQARVSDLAQSENPRRDVVEFLESVALGFGGG